MMAVIFEVYEAFGLTMSKIKTKTMTMPVRGEEPYVSVVKASGQGHAKMSGFAYLAASFTKPQGVPSKSGGAADWLDGISSVTKSSTTTDTAHSSA